MQRMRIYLLIIGIIAVVILVIGNYVSGAFNEYRLITQFTIAILVATGLYLPLTWLRVPGRIVVPVSGLAALGSFIYTYMKWDAIITGFTQRIENAIFFGPILILIICQFGLYLIPRD